MSRAIQILILMTAVLFFSGLPAMAQGQVHTQVKVIHASGGAPHVDPDLVPIIRELESVFKYTAYRLVTSQNMMLGLNQKGRVRLPGNRVLVITPLQIKGQRISYQINILKERRSIFQTRILLRNNSSVTIGGPRFKNGVILFNIRGSAR